MKKRIVIVGGGFGGVRAALDLARRDLDGVKILLISDKPHFEYHAALYRVVTGKSPLEVCVPLREIFQGTNVELVTDAISGANLYEQTLMGSSDSRYSYDALVLALGSETAYFNIPGLQELSYGFKSIPEAMRLKRHLHEIFSACASLPPEGRVCAAHLVVVGGGASGTELAGELALYTRGLAELHGLDFSLVTIDLIEAAPRLLPLLPPDVSERVWHRLHKLGVNIFLNRALEREDVEGVYLKDMELKTKTVIWTAGVKTNKLYSIVRGLSLDKKGKAEVDPYLRVKEFENVFVIGDAAATPYSGMAQTALYEGRAAAENIIRIIENQPLLQYRPRKPFYAVPVGAGWAATLLGSVRVYGRIGWWLRRLADFRFFLSILPFRKAVTAFRSNKTLCESCSICMPELKTAAVEGG